MKPWALISLATLLSTNAAFAGDFETLENQFRDLPMEARRLTGPLFWMHGDENETPERLESYLEKVAEGGNGCFTAESRPHRDWLGPNWYRDLDICLQKAKALDLQMWIFDERWWPSQSIGGNVPPRYSAKSLVAEPVDVSGPRSFSAAGYDGNRYIGAVAGHLNAAGEIEGDSLLDLAPFIENGTLSWSAPAGDWRVIKFTHKQAPGLGQRGGKELSVDGASRDCTDWFIKTVYQPHYDRFKNDFGKSIPGFFYDEPETKGDWGTELDVILKEWGVDWKKAYVAYTSKLAGDDDLAARYQYMEAVAEAWGRVMYGGMTKWCEDRGVASIGHFMEHGNLYLRPDYCGGDMMRVQKYSSMGGIDMVVRQMYPGQRPRDIYQTPKLGSSISHVYGKKDDLAMCEIFGGYNQVLTYPQMKWLTDQHQVRGINFMIPHSFNPKAPHDRDYPPYFYNDGHEPRWPLYRVYADYTSRLSLMLTGGRHVCPVAVLFSGNARRVGKYVTPEDMTTVLQDALYDCDWLPFEAFERDATVDDRDVTLHKERYQILVVPPTEVIPHPTLAKAKRFFDQGGVVVGYGRLPSKSGTVGAPSSAIAQLREAVWGADPKPGPKACRTSAAGGRSYFLPEKPDVDLVIAALHGDAGIPPVIEVLEGETGNWLHVLHRVKEGRDVFLIANQHHEGSARSFSLLARAEGVPECWDAMRNEFRALPYRAKEENQVRFDLTLEPLESVLVVFQPEPRPLPARLKADAQPVSPPINVRRLSASANTPAGPSGPAPVIESVFKGCSWVWHAADPKNVPPGKRFFRGVLDLPAGKTIKVARIRISADNDFALFVNGKSVGKGSGGLEDWRRARMFYLHDFLKPGRNVLAVQAVNMGDAPNPAGFIGRYTVLFGDTSKVTGCIDTTWRSTQKEQAGWTKPEFDDAEWSRVAALADYGGAPWGAFDGKKRITLPTITQADPFTGTFELPADWLGKDRIVYLETSDLPHESAAAVTINKRFAGGFIGKPFRLDVTRFVKAGKNTLIIEPFAPDSVRIINY